MKPYYEAEGITIYHGDCLEALVELEISASTTITDPPFSSGARADAGKSMRGAMTRKEGRWGSDWFSHDNMATVGFAFLMRYVCQRIFEVTVQGGSLHAFIDWRMYPHLYGAAESTGWIAKNLIVWDKKSFGMGDNYRNQHELILYAQKPGDREFYDRATGNVLSYSRPGTEYHPTEKSIDLIQRMIKATTTPGQLVLDCFMGSGTTLVAAKNLGRRAVGVEIDERYCEIAALRLSQGILELGAVV